MKTLTLTLDGMVLFTKLVDIDARRTARVIDRVSKSVRTTAEIVADGVTLRNAWEATLTKEQKDEIARVAALPKDVREKEILQQRVAMLAAQKLAAESRLVAVGAKIEAKPIEEVVKP